MVILNNTIDSQFYSVVAFRSNTKLAKNLVIVGSPIVKSKLLIFANPKGKVILVAKPIKIS